jgi:hypothetical protein
VTAALLTEGFLIDVLRIIEMNVPNRFHNSGKRPKARLKPQAVRARKAALKALKRKLGA